MSVRRVVANIPSERMDESRRFYCELFDFRIAMDMGWIMTLVSPSNPTAQISLARGAGLAADSSTPQMTLTIEVEDVDAIHARAVEMGIVIHYPLTSEAWGVRRFGVTDPNGVSLNVMSHRPQ